MSQVAERGTGGWWFLRLPGCWLAFHPENDGSAASYTLPRGASRFRSGTDGLEKYCSYCREWWPTECFAPHRGGAGGLDNRCRACKSDRAHGSREVRREA